MAYYMAIHQTMAKIPWNRGSLDKYRDYSEAMSMPWGDATPRRSAPVSEDFGVIANSIRWLGHFELWLDLECGWSSTTSMPVPNTEVMSNFSFTQNVVHRNYKCGSSRPTVSAGMYSGCGNTFTQYIHGT